MNILYLLKILNTEKLSEVVAMLDLPPLDMNLVIWEAIDRKEITVDPEKDVIKALKEAVPWKNEELADKILRTIKHYAANGSNITVGRLNSQIKDQVTNIGYPIHEYLMSTQFLIDEGRVLEDVIEVPKTKKRPLHKFVFLCLPECDNTEMNAKAVNKWIADFESSKVK